jgi:hypothetical protein
MLAISVTSGARERNAWRSRQELEGSVDRRRILEQFRDVRLKNDYV